MNRRSLRSPRERVGTLPNADLPPPDTDPDPDLMLRRALMDRAEDAFATVARGLRPEVIIHYVRSPDEAEDVVQETGMAARAIPVSHRPAVAASDEGVRRGQRPLFMPPPRSPADTVLDREPADRLSQCIAALPHRQRDVLVLRDAEGFSGDHVCRALGLTASHHRVLLHPGAHAGP